MAKRRRKKKRDGRGIRRRHQGAAAVRALFISEATRKAKEAEAAMRYTWSQVGPGKCEECGTIATSLLDGQPPVDAAELPHAERICMECAVELEALARGISE